MTASKYVDYPLTIAQPPSDDFSRCAHYAWTRRTPFYGPEARPSERLIRAHRGTEGARKRRREKHALLVPRLLELLVDQDLGAHSIRELLKLDKAEERYLLSRCKREGLIESRWSDEPVCVGYQGMRVREYVWSLTDTGRGQAGRVNP